jgi:methylmalonyl-CoA/ethylmalonyl-CoA epimerase
MYKPTKINHIALAVTDMEAALAFWRDALGLPLDRLEDVPAESARVAFFPAGDTEIELVQPTTTDSGLAAYLEKRGPGMHHICVEVDDIAAMMAQLRERGIELINESHRVREDGIFYAFVHPKSTHGVLVELYQLP